MTLSVVIPCYNAAPYLAQTLGTVLRQTLTPDDIIIADDGSTDGSQDIAAAFPGVTRLDGPFGGAGPARMAGLAAAKGEAVMFLDADDLLRLDTLEYLKAALPAGGIARCAWQRYEKLGAAWIVRPPSCAPKAPWQDELSAWLTGWYAPPCALLWSRAAVDRAGGWTTEGVSNDDGDLVMRALTAGVPMAKAKGGTAYYRRLPGEAQTLSGRRFSEEALQGRLFVTERIEKRLDEQGRRGAYASALRTAYAAIERDAPAQSAVRAAAAARRAALPALPGKDAAIAAARRRTGYAARRFARRDLRVRSPAPLPSGARRALQDPLISVVIPTYDRPDETARAVESVRRQTHRHLDIIVVDDAGPSAPYTPPPDEERLTVIRHERNEGVAAARNTGIAAARGALVAFLDSDDFWREGKLARQIERLRSAGPRCGLVYTGYERQGGDRADIGLPEAEGDIFAALLRRNVLYSAPSSALLTKEALEAVGGFDGTLPAAEDWDFVLRVSRLYEVAAVSAPLAILGQEDDPKRRSLQLRANLDARAMIFERYKDDLRRAGAERAFLMETARRALSEAGADPRQGRRDVLRALAAWPPDPRLLPWLPYMLAPAALRSTLRRLDGRVEPRAVR